MRMGKILGVLIIGAFLFNSGIVFAAKVNPSLEAEINTLIGNIVNKAEVIRMAEKASGKLNQKDPQQKSLKADVDLAIAHLNNEVTKMNVQLDALNNLADMQKSGVAKNTEMQTYLDTQAVKLQNPLPTRDAQHTANLQSAMNTASSASKSNKNKRDYQIASTFLKADPQSISPKEVPNNVYGSVNNPADGDDNNNYQSAAELEKMQARRNQNAQRDNNTYEAANQALDAPLGNNRPQLRRQDNQQFNMPSNAPLSDNNNNVNNDNVNNRQYPPAAEFQQREQFQQQVQAPVRHNQFQPQDFEQQQQTQTVTNNSQYQDTSQARRDNVNPRIQAIPRGPRIQQVPGRPLPKDPAPSQVSNGSDNNNSDDNNNFTNNNNSAVQQPFERPLPPSNRPLPPGSPPAAANQPQFSAVNSQPQQRRQTSAVGAARPLPAVQNNPVPRRRVGTTNSAVQSTSSQVQQTSAGPRQRNNPVVQNNNNQNAAVNYEVLPADPQADGNLDADQNNQTVPQGSQNRQGIGGRMNNNNNNGNNRNDNNNNRRRKK